MAIRKKLIVEKILGVANIVAKKSIKASSGVVGFRCDLFYPRLPVPDDVPRIFDSSVSTDSQRFDYSLVPTETKVLLVLGGIFGDNFSDSDSTFDNTRLETTWILTDKDYKIPVGTKVHVYREDNLHVLKVIHHDVYPSVKEGQIYHKNYVGAFF